MKKRKDKIAYIETNYLGQSATVLEISPSINPMLTEQDSYNVEYLDACTTQELQDRAIQAGRDIHCAPSINYLHDFNQSIAHCVGHKKFDFVVSSHVIEHVPDLVGHFNEVREILNDNGKYAFFAPDKDLCFDAKKPSSSLGQIVEARLEKRRVASVSALIDEYYYGVKRAGSGAWSNSESAPFSPKYIESRKLILDVLKNPMIAESWHGHIWRFTPASFNEVFNELNQLGLVDLSLVEVVPTKHMEFIVVLSAGES
jgi:SAM-dependent methyltransferase